MSGWPPDQPLNKKNNVRFEQTDVKDYYQFSNPFVRTIPGFGDGVPPSGTLIGADNDGGLVQPKWRPPSDYILGQTLYPTDDVNFNVVTLSDSAVAEGEVKASLNVIVNDFGPGLDQYYSLPNEGAARDGFARAIWSEDIPGSSEFTPQLKDLHVSTTNPSVYSELPVADGTWNGGGSGFTPGVWHSFALNAVPGPPTYDVVSNVDNGNPGEEWLRVSQEPVHLLRGASGLFVVDWTLSYRPSVTYANLAVDFEFLIACNDPAGSLEIPILNSFTLTNKATQRTPSIAATDVYYTTLSGHGLINVESGQNVTFYGRVGASAPPLGNIYVKNLSFSLKRLIPY